MMIFYTKSQGKNRERERRFMMLEVLREKARNGDMVGELIFLTAVVGLNALLLWDLGPSGYKDMLLTVLGFYAIYVVGVFVVGSILLLFLFLLLPLLLREG